jgi:hypothetical protein
VVYAIANLIELYASYAERCRLQTTHASLTSQTCRSPARVSFSFGADPAHLARVLTQSAPPWFGPRLDMITLDASREGILTLRRYILRHLLRIMRMLKIVQEDTD